jgi:TonB family protein
LLATALLALLLPALPSLPAATAVLKIELPTVVLVPGADPGGTNWFHSLVYAHFAMTILLVMRLGVRCAQVLVGMRRGTVGPSSFFHLIRVPSDTAAVDREALMAHERVHAEQGHSFDVIVYELIAAIFWTNPLWRIALRELRLVHEHTADAIARTLHTNYDALLLAHALRVPSSSLLNTFGSSNLKKRMIMLHNCRSPRLARRKLLLALPALLLALTLVSWQATPINSAISGASSALVFAGVDQQPEFPGGMEALGRYLQENLRYPKSAMEAKAEGLVYVGFTVKANGQITAVNVKRGVRTDMDQESVRVVAAMPAWKPGMSKGKAVDAEMTLPISFRLGTGK